ncbi:MAG: hypothetical protein ACRENP_00310 [Longimicrobiales bacterium]
MQVERLLAFAVMLNTVIPAVGHAQRLVDWPVRTSALPDAIVTGAAATFWNPAGLTTGNYRAQVLVVNLRTPESLELRGLAAAGALQLDRTILAAGLEHVGIDDFTRTDDSPSGPGAEEFDLGENHFTLAAAHRVSPAFTVGASARYTRDNLNETDPVVGVGAGFNGTFTLPWRVQVGAYAGSEADELAWAAGAEVELPSFLGDPYRIGLSYGAQADARVVGPVHRLAARFDWKERGSVSAGLAREPDVLQAHWTPVLAASLQLNRYTLGVVRENLVSDFGATYTFRLQIGLGP